MAARRPKFANGFTPATAAELDAASLITETDIARAKAQWGKDAPPSMRRLLDAKAVKPKKPVANRSINSNQPPKP